jgi:hypothetical protein
MLPTKKMPYAKEILLHPWGFSFSNLVLLRLFFRLNINQRYAHTALANCNLQQQKYY